MSCLNTLNQPASEISFFYHEKLKKKKKLTIQYNLQLMKLKKNRHNIIVC